MRLKKYKKTKNIIKYIEQKSFLKCVIQSSSYIDEIVKLKIHKKYKEIIK